MDSRSKLHLYKFSILISPLFPPISQRFTYSFLLTFPSLVIMLALTMRDQDKDNRLQKYSNERRESSWKRTKRILNVHYISIKNTLVSVTVVLFLRHFLKLEKEIDRNLFTFLPLARRLSESSYWRVEYSDHQLNETRVLMSLQCSI